MFFIFAWCLKDETSFMDAVPLHLIAESHRRYGSTIPIKAVMLEGHDKLSPAYLEHLASLGLEVLDHTHPFRDIVAAFPNISARYSHYERNCFLRWIAFRDILAERNVPGQVWHLDGDVILHASTDAIAADCASKTFMLQGCPALVSVSERSWFSIYAEELARLEADVNEYSNRARDRKAEVALRDRELCNISLFRNPIGSDQDLLQYLVSSGTLPQERTERIFASEFYFIQNALVAQWWDAYQPTPGARTVTADKDGRLIKGNRGIPFIHYQSDFCRYCELYLALNRYGLGRLTPQYIAPSGAGAVRLKFRLVSKPLRTLGMRRLTRAEIMAEMGKSDRPGSPSRLIDAINQINFRDSPENAESKALF